MIQQKNIELVVVDLDGTLLNEESKMSERNEKALKAAMEKGVKVVIATGKTRFSARDVIARLDLQTPGIYTQGLTIYNAAGVITTEWKLDPDVARRVITFAEDRGFSMIAYSGDRILTHTDSPHAKGLHEKYGEPEPEAVGPLQNILTEMTIHKLIAAKLGEPARINALRWQLSMQLDGRARLVKSAVMDMVEVLPPNGSKGTALKSVLRSLGISAENTLAIGDAENDLEMLQLAGVGVAMGNANDHLKAVADHVVGTNREDGVAEAIEKFVLGEAIEVEKSIDTAVNIVSEEAATSPLGEASSAGEASSVGEASSAAASPAETEAKPTETEPPTENSEEVEKSE